MQNDEYLRIKIFSDGCEPNEPEGHAIFFQALMENIFFRSPERNRVGLSDLKRKTKFKLVTPRSLESILLQFREDNVESYDIRPENLSREAAFYSLYGHLFFEKQYGEEGKFDMYDLHVPGGGLIALSMSVEEFTSALLACLSGVKILAAYVDCFSGRRSEYYDYHRWWTDARERGVISSWRRRGLGYFWLQILSETHVELLGGKERILRDYPHSFELENASNSLVLKVTEKLSEMTERHYVDLYYFLRPILSDPSTLSVAALASTVSLSNKNGISSTEYYKRTKYFFSSIDDYRFAVEKVAQIEERGLTFLHNKAEIEEILGEKL